MIKWFNSAGNAVRGWVVFFRSERNARIQLICLVLVISAGIWLEITRFEWMAVLTVSAVVLALEMVNTALESTLDHLHPDKHIAVQKAKDVAAGAVLLASLFAAIIGLIVFLPYLTTLFAQ